MNDEDIAKLQDEDEWDFDAAERQRAPRGNRAIVSVGFRQDDFALVADAARRKDQPVSQFIREAALDRARTGHDEPRSPLATRAIVIQIPKIDETLFSEALKRHQRRLASA